MPISFSDLVSFPPTPSVTLSLHRTSSLLDLPPQKLTPKLVPLFNIHWSQVNSIPNNLT